MLRAKLILFLSGGEQGQLQTKQRSLLRKNGQLSQWVSGLRRLSPQKITGRKQGENREGPTEVPATK
jgi:hypothetical protein